MQITRSSMWMLILCTFVTQGLLGVLSAQGQGSDKNSGSDRDQFLSVGDLDASIVIDMAYYGSDNFVGERMDGYDNPVCLLTKNAANALVKVHKELQEYGMALKIFDCYRPQKAVDHFIRWAGEVGNEKTKVRYYPNVEKTRVFDLGYVARRSGHSRGSTIDLTVVYTGEGMSDITERSYDCRYPDYSHSAELNMGTGYDCFDELSHTANPTIDSEARKNRLLLRSVMEKHGFDNYSKEWWHFTYRNEPFRETYFDFDL